MDYRVIVFGLVVILVGGCSLSSFTKTTKREIPSEELERHIKDYWKEKESKNLCLVQEVDSDWLFSKQINSRVNIIYYRVLASFEEFLMPGDYLITKSGGEGMTTWALAFRSAVVPEKDSLNNPSLGFVSVSQSDLIDISSESAEGLSSLKKHSLGRNYFVEEMIPLMPLRFVVPLRENETISDFDIVQAYINMKEKF